MCDGRAEWTRSRLATMLYANAFQNQSREDYIGQLKPSYRYIRDCNVAYSDEAWEPGET